MVIRFLILCFVLSMNFNLFLSRSINETCRISERTSLETDVNCNIGYVSAIVKCCNKLPAKQSWIYDNLLDLIGTLITLIGFFFAILQLNRQAKTMEGELALKLDDKMFQHRIIYKELYPGGTLFDNIPKEKVEDIEYYLTFYDTLSILVKNHQINLDQINRLYGFRFLTVMHNKSVQRIVEDKIHSWAGLNWLYPRILDIRKNRKDEIPSEEHEWKNYLPI
jgi:hypothetical protein